MKGNAGNCDLLDDGSVVVTKEHRLMCILRREKVAQILNDDVRVVIRLQKVVPHTTISLREIVTLQAGWNGCASFDRIGIYSILLCDRSCNMVFSGTSPVVSCVLSTPPPHPSICHVSLLGSPLPTFTIAVLKYVGKACTETQTIFAQGLLT